MHHGIIRGASLFVIVLGAIASPHNANAAQQTVHHSCTDTCGSSSSQQSQCAGQWGGDPGDWYDQTGCLDVMACPPEAPYTLFCHE
jgi:hypothetical protein